MYVLSWESCENLKNLIVVLDLGMIKRTIKAEVSLITSLLCLLQVGLGAVGEGRYDTDIYGSGGDRYESQISYNISFYMR